jgi:hypothetical protein
MFQVVQVPALALVAVALSFSLAHAAELPGKMRLSKETYLAIQPIYYPGFTIGGGVGEVGSMIALLVLLVVTPYQSKAFWWTLAAFISLLVMHLIYWFVTHPRKQRLAQGRGDQGVQRGLLFLRGSPKTDSPLTGRGYVILGNILTSRELSLRCSASSSSPLP